MRSKIVSLLAVAFSLGFAQAASAADMPVKAPIVKAPMAPVAVPYNWTGFYVGIEGGGAWGRAEQTDTLPFTSGRYNTSGGFAGGTLGYNWQMGQTVLGLETDLSWAGIKGSTTGTDPASGPCGGIPARCDTSINALGTFRGRIGYAWQNLLPYVTGGFAYANIHGSEGTGAGGGAFGSGSKWQAGWTLGAGLEGVIAPRWTAKIEYLYVDLGNGGVFNDTIGPLTLIQKLRETANIVRVGVNYRFGN